MMKLHFEKAEWNRTSRNDYQGWFRRCLSLLCPDILVNTVPMTFPPNPSRGRPGLPLPDPIPDTPENVAKAILSTPPKSPTDWKFLKLKGKKSSPS